MHLDQLFYLKFDPEMCKIQEKSMQLSYWPNI